ncbi:MAG TPA: hypothetical protein VME43_03330 [Bryobacteraceae bacterium]|nr:hypothetical protein [Bryobacteraceae bacterium]
MPHNGYVMIHHPAPRHLSEHAQSVPASEPGERLTAGAGYPPQWFDELQFAGDSYLTAADLEQDAALGPSRRIQALLRDGGRLHCDLRLRLRTMSNLH